MTNKVKIYSLFDRPIDPGVKDDFPSMTQQQFADEANINSIMDKYYQTGYLTDPFITPKGQAIYGDFSEIQDFQERQQVFINAKENFDALPARIRAQFNNDMYQLLSFVSNPDNLQEAVEMGLAEAPDSYLLDVTVPTDTKQEKGEN